MLKSSSRNALNTPVPTTRANSTPAASSTTQTPGFPVTGSSHGSSHLPLGSSHLPSQLSAVISEQKELTPISSYTRNTQQTPEPQGPPSNYEHYTTKYLPPKQKIVIDLEPIDLTDEEEGKIRTTHTITHTTTTAMTPEHIPQRRTKTNTSKAPILPLAGSQPATPTSELTGASGRNPTLQPNMSPIPLPISTAPYDLSNLTGTTRLPLAVWLHIDAQLQPPSGPSPNKTPLPPFIKLKHLLSCARHITDLPTPHPSLTNICTLPVLDEDEEITHYTRGDCIHCGFDSDMLIFKNLINPSQSTTLSSFLIRLLSLRTRLGHAQHWQYRSQQELTKLESVLEDEEMFVEPDAIKVTLSLLEDPIVKQLALTNVSVLKVAAQTLTTRCTK